ncbi:MAG: Cys-Gln thioester bond-forming surface protein [Oscillospiraceae bacterium]|jgi:LPXTG-motif cell wall-anchored protein|nr:Cys-Gln thioester bond-forming surface protein [Oscillospiraceae bacterium]
MKITVKRGLAFLLTLASFLSLFTGIVNVSAMDLSQRHTVSWDYTLTDEDGNTFTWYGGIDSSSNAFGHSYGNTAHTIHDYTVKRHGLTGDKGDWTYDSDYVYAFCIEPGVPLPNYDDYMANYTDKWGRLSDNQKDLIGLALSYGYPNRRDVQTSKDANACYAATQLIVWQCALNWRTSPTDLNDRSYAMSGYSGTMTQQLTANPYFKSFYDRILSDMANHGTRPSFMSGSTTTAPVYELTQSGGQYTVTLTDNNNVLSDFYVSNAGGLSASISGNTLTIRSNTPITSEVQITLERRMPSTNMTTGFLTWSVPGKEGANQDMVTGVPNDPLRAYLKLKVSTGMLAIIKTSQYNNGSVSGFQFEVRNSSNALVGTYTSGADGVITIPGLLAGTYSVKEINLSSDFVQPVPNPKSVTVTAGGTSSVSFDNIKKRGILSIRKSDANFTLGGYSLAGAEFEVRDVGGTLVDTITSGADGTGQSKILPLGVYRIKETKAPYGFEFDTNTYTVALSGTQGNGEVVYAPDTSIAEQPEVGRINLEKSNKTPLMGDYNLAGARYEIRASEDIKRIDGSFYAHTGDLVDTIITDTNGKAQSKDLHLGSYIVKEVNAPYGYLLDGGSYPVTLSYGGQTVPVVYATVNSGETPEPGRIRVHKYNQSPDMGDYDLQGAKFEIRADEDLYTRGGVLIHAKGQLVDTITVDTNGDGTSKDLPLGKYTVKEVNAPYGYTVNTNTYPAVLSYAGQTVLIAYTDTSNPQRPQTGKLILEKQDLSTGRRAQGDSTLAGMVAEIYAAETLKDRKGNIIHSKDELLETLYCGDSTSVTSSELPLGKYYWREKVPPVGYTLDDRKNPFEIVYAGMNVTVTHNEKIHKNKVIEGKIALVKHTDLPDPNVDNPRGGEPENPQIEKPLEGAVFQIYLRKAGSYDAALETERDLLTTNENGYCESKLLPYGVYVVKEISAPGDVKLVEPFTVFIASDGRIYRYILNDPTFKSLVKIIKVDSTTGKRIPAAGVTFKVWDVANNKWVQQSFNYPVPTTIDEYVTAEDGTLVMPEVLPSGDYLLYEQEAPWGYVLSKDPVPFTIHSSQENQAIAEVIMANAPQMGIIKVEKKGNMLTGVTVTDTAFGKQHTPIYSLTGLPGATFNVVASEDVYTGDGTLRYAKGAVVDTITTGADGYAESKQLYLGRYEVIETKAPTGFVLDKTPHPAALEYEGQEKAVITTQIGIDNTRQTVEIDLQKLMERPVNAPNGFSAYQDVVFALYSNEDIKAVDGKTAIPKGSLIALIPIDENGKGSVTGELPFAKYLVKEVQTNIYYQLNGTAYPITAEYKGQDVEVSKISVNNGGIAIPNELKLGKIIITKTGEMLTGAVQGSNKDYVLYTPVYEVQNLPGATFNIVTDEDIYDVYGKLLVKKGTVVDTVTTDKTGVAMSKLLHLGRYVLIETAAPYGTVLDSTPLPVTLGFDGEISDVITTFITVHNERQKAEIDLTKACEIPEGAAENYNPYGGIIFGLYAREDVKTADGEVVIPADSLMEFVTFGANGKADIKTDLPFGKFYVQEFKTEYGYALNSTQYDLAFDYDATAPAKVSVAVNGGEAIPNELQRGSLKIIKVFEGVTTPISGIPFHITGKTLVGTTVEIDAATNGDGDILLEGLLVGEYTVAELESPLSIGYVLSEPQTLTVTADKIAEMTVENKLQRGDLKIIKTFENVSTPIQGVKFHVSGTSLTGIPFNSEFETDTNGEILIEGLPIGEYKVKEIASDLTTGYILSDEQTALVAADELAEMRIDNKLIRGDIKIYKTDSKTGKPLAGAKFGLYQGDTLITEDITGADGYAAFLNIAYGEYEIREISAPEGYQRTDKVFKAVIKENGETLTFEVTNNLVPPPGTPPKTGDTSNATLYLALMGASAAGLVLTLRRKRATK